MRHQRLPCRSPACPLLSHPDQSPPEASALLTSWGCDLDVIGIHRGLGGLPKQQGGSFRQVQCTQLGGAIRNWEKGGGPELFPAALPTPRLPKLCWTSRLPLAPPTPPFPFPVHSQLPPCPHFLPLLPARVPDCLTCGKEACERLTLLKATDGDHGHVVVSTWDEPLEFLGPGSAIHLNTLWLP